MGRKTKSAAKAVTKTGKEDMEKVGKNCQLNNTKTPKRDNKVQSSSITVAAAVASTSKNNDIISLEDQNVNQSENPLMNALILDNLFGHIKCFEHLKNIRQVCKLWKKLSLKQWRSIATLKLGPPSKKESDGIPAAIPSSKHSDFWPIDNYWQRLQDPTDDNELSEKPFKKYIFSGFDIKTCWVLQPILDDANGENTFWDTIREHVISLTFEKCTFPGEQPEYFEKIITEKLPNLETLSIMDITNSPTKLSELDRRFHTIANLKPDQYASYLSGMKLCENLKTLKIKGEAPMCFYMMLLNMPNIESLQLDNNLLNNGEYSIMSFERFYNQRLKLTTIPFPLKHLDLMGVQFFNWSLGLGRNWQRYNFPLESLSVTISLNRLEFDDERDSDVRDVLVPLVRCGAERLKILKVFRPPVFKISDNNPFPVCMESLRELYLYGNIVDNLEFLKNMSQLEVLHVDYDCYDKLQNMYKLFVGNRNDGHYIKLFRESYRDNTSESHRLIKPANSREYGRLKHMKKCHLNVTFYQDEVWNTWKTSSPIEVLAEWMPNLTTLEINLNKQDFRAVCKHLPNLEELVLLFKSQIDDDAVTGLETGKKERCSENITSFKKLKKFQLKQPCWLMEWKSNNSLSDASVYEGFLKMNCLDAIRICVSPKMTAAAERALKQHVPNVQVIRNYDDKNPHGDAECCSIKYADLELGGCFD